MLIPNFSFAPVLNKLKQFSLWLFSLLSLFGCQAGNITVEEIADKRVGKTVSLVGKVVHVAPFLDNSAYQLEDSTGKIWVVTTEAPPSLDEQIEVKGKIQYQSLPFDDRELGDFYLVELEQTYHQILQPIPPQVCHLQPEDLHLSITRLMPTPKPIPMQISKPMQMSIPTQTTSKPMAIL